MFSSSLKRSGKERSAKKMECEQSKETIHQIGKESSKLTLDKYLSFLRTRDGRPLSVSDLNQLILIHGFKKICRGTKPVLMEALRQMEPMDPSRSTLLSFSSVRPTPALLLDEVVRDIADLNWQECPVVSVRAINSALSTNDSTTSLSTAGGNRAYQAAVDSKASEEKKEKRNERKKKMILKKKEEEEKQSSGLSGGGKSFYSSATIGSALALVESCSSWMEPFPVEIKNKNKRKKMTKSVQSTAA